MRIKTPSNLSKPINTIEFTSVQGIEDAWMPSITDEFKACSFNKGRLYNHYSNHKDWVIWQDDSQQHGFYIEGIKTIKSFGTKTDKETITTVDGTEYIIEIGSLLLPVLLP